MFVLLSQTWRFSRGFVAALLSAALLPAVVAAEEAKPGEEPPDAPAASADRPAQQAMRKMAGEVELTVQADEKAEPRPLKLRSQPLLSYGDETRFIKDSTLWVWMDGERPAVFQKLEVNDWVVKNPLWTWCFASASPGIVEARWPGVVNPSRTSRPIAWQTIAGATVSDNAKAWPTEARALNRRFTAETGPEATRGNTPEVLRAVARPLLEFKAPDQGVPYGAVFSHAGGTNPNVLLIVQVETLPDGGRRWSYAPMHMTATKVTLRLDGEIVWTDPAQKTGVFSNWGFFFVRRDPGLK